MDPSLKTIPVEYKRQNLSTTIKPEILLDNNENLIESKILGVRITPNHVNVDTAQSKELEEMNSKKPSHQSTPMNFNSNVTSSSLCSVIDFPDENGRHHRPSFPYSPILRKENASLSYLDDIDCSVEWSKISPINKNAELSNQFDDFSRRISLDNSKPVVSVFTVNDKIDTNAPTDVQNENEIAIATTIGAATNVIPISLAEAEASKVEALAVVQKPKRGRPRKAVQRDNRDKEDAGKVKEVEKLEKQRQKDKLKLERQRAKGEQEAEKARIRELQKANKLKIDKSEMVKEMIVDVESILMQQPFGPILREILEAKLVTVNEVYQSIPNTISWRRKITTEWNEEIDAFIPIPERIQEDDHILIYLPFMELCDMIEGMTLHDYHQNLYRQFVGKKLIYLVEGFQEYLRKKKTQRNRNFNQAVRSAIGEISGESGQSSKKKKTENLGLDKEKLEEELIWLQVVGKCQIVHTNNPNESGEMIDILTTNIASIPYKSIYADLNFCMENQIRSGSDPSDTWFRMLQEIQMVTPPVAKAITREYPTLKSLYVAYKQCQTRKEGETLLSNVEIVSTALGHQNRKINKSISQRIYEIFMGNESNALIP